MRTTVDAKPFTGTADGPELVIDRAGDGTPLPTCRGWTCGRCEVIWATEDGAEACCRAPDDTSRPPPANGRWPRLYTPD